MSDYQQLALRTKSDAFYAEKVSLKELIYRADAFTEAAEALDAIKKSLFYGKQYPITPSGRRIMHLEQSTIDMLHAAIGIATEAGELIGAVVTALANGEPIDVVNFQEELGDLGWYRAIGAEGCGKTLPELDEQNIAKLTKRFPDRFTEHAALNRDLVAERKTLEAAA